MKCYTSPVRLRPCFNRTPSLLAVLLLLAVALFGLKGHAVAQEQGPVSGIDAWAALPAEHVEGWAVLPWFGAYCEFPGWIYHAEHGWQYLTARLTGSFQLYDVRLGLWSWSSSAYYPWIYWYGPVHAWTWYACGGTPGERWFHHATAGEWLAESQLPLLTGHLPQMVRVDGGRLALSIGTTDVATFSIGRHELTWGEWQQVRAWAAANGYDIGSTGSGCAADHPVHAINWYDALKGCNAKSEMDGLTPVYSVGGLVYRSGQVVPVQNLWADGYRLPLETEWEYAARGGNRTNGYTYSGSNELDAVGWFAGNSSGAACPVWNGNGTWPVGQKAANELGLHDMSGNLWEWCWDAAGADRRVRGGSVTTATTQGCSVSSRGYNNPAASTGSDGLRLARSNVTAPAGMITIAPGSFTMGSPTNEPGRESGETQHKVTLTRAFHLQRTEVTKAEWDAVQAEGAARGYTDLATGRNGLDGDASGTHPVTDVSWFDVIKWLNLKSELEGLAPCYTVGGTVMKTGTQTPACNFTASGYRLPTESEWEYAARAGTSTAFHSGPITHTSMSPLDPNLDLIGWYGGNSGSNTHPVGGKEPNAWGLYDMSGNVAEWCWDWYGTYPGTVTDPTGPASGAFRVQRGGTYHAVARFSRSAFRVSSNPTFRSNVIGFRPARSVFEF